MDWLDSSQLDIDRYLATCCTTDVCPMNRTHARLCHLCPVNRITPIILEYVQCMVDINVDISLAKQ